MLISKFKKLISQFNITFAVVAFLEEDIVEMIGNKNDLISVDLVDNLFGDTDCISNLNHSLEGQEMPRMWSQGRVSCIICKPLANVIVGIIYHETRDAVEQYHWSKKVDTEVQKIWSKE